MDFASTSGVQDIRMVDSSVKIGLSSIVLKARMFTVHSAAQATEHLGDLWEALASGANCASYLLFLSPM